MADITLLQRLCELHGISGRERQVADVILKEISPFVTTVQKDALGNIIAFKKGAKEPSVRLMLSAHMDEVGLIVTHIGENGLLKFAEVGGIDRRVLCAKPVLVGGTVSGVIGAKPIHLLEREEKGKSVPVSDMYIDIGAKDKADAERYVSPGDFIAFDAGFHREHGTIISRALDDRAGCAILIDMIKEELAYDMTFVFCVQEEVGLRGSAVAAYTVDPQAAIVVETTTAGDIAGVEPERQVCHVGQGPVLSFMDRRTIYDKPYFDLAMKLAEEQKIPCQTKQAVAGGNDAGAIHTTRSGVRTIAVSIACRYLHGPASLIAEQDYHDTERLVRELAVRISAGEGAQ
ncbi:M42 family metallopeptidase [Faecalispora jeddahensis]|uniref:M42 family metallopeptidase n=1 Tax=Faecalispora jeddahensis TaxID=1414721 RepID=UPI0027BA13A8|nr:M42 family metallopeptidase [Faecalispora jeddahensis]